ncbi:MAG TPA: hypothetical protein DCW90_15635 [Lachnospiraceae bacterium]|nr:3-oxoacyl-[acyl-carrier-protein] synthase III C-terminal domain-containing protein [uncultured Lachnoclostridium sp.]HAU86863.1 hypothetical protein [Lachnospiraceae bacterium]
MKQGYLSNIRIKGIEIYYPEDFDYVDDIITKYKEQGIDIELELKDSLGKNIVHHIKSKDENTLTMAVKAAKKVLDSTGLTGKDLDQIALATLSPEYILPATARLIHTMVEGKEEAFCYDINANCSGMLFSMNQIAAQMQSSDSLHYVMLIGSDSPSIHMRNDQYISKSILGDSACAIILEKTDTDSSILDHKFLCNYTHPLSVACGPCCGLSHIHEAPIEDQKIILGKAPIQTEVISTHIQEVLARNNLTVDDISLFCFSQYSKSLLNKLAKKLEISMDKVIYNGDKYGYTGVTCTFIALYDAIQEKKIKRGDYVFFWTFGSGVEMVFTLMRY